MCGGVSISPAALGSDFRQRGASLQEDQNREPCSACGGFIVADMGERVHVAMHAVNSNSTAMLQQPLEQNQPQDWQAMECQRQSDAAAAWNVRFLL